MQAHLVADHQLGGGALDVPVQRRKLDLVWISAHVPERSLDRVKVVSTDSDESPLTAQVLVQLVLEGDERLVFELVERPRETQNG